GLQAAGDQLLLPFRQHPQVAGQAEAELFLGDVVVAKVVKMSVQILERLALQGAAEEALEGVRNLVAVEPAVERDKAATAGQAKLEEDTRPDLGNAVGAESVTQVQALGGGLDGLSVQTRRATANEQLLIRIRAEARLAALVAADRRPGQLALGRAAP